MADSSPQSVGLVLSGGGTKLYAHIGFLWALDDAGLLSPGAPLSAVVGNSAGSVAGAMFALGYSPREMWETAFWRIFGYTPPPEPRAWRSDSRPRGLDVALDLDWQGLARALTEHLSYFKGLDTGLRFEALLRKILEPLEADGRPNPYYGGTRPPEALLPLYLIGYNLTNRRETIFEFRAHCAPGPLQLGPGQVPLGREAWYEVCTDRADPSVPPEKRFRPWEAVRISTSLPLAFRPYFKPRFISTHWDEQGVPFQTEQGSYFSDGGARDNYSLSGALKIAGCDAVFGCFLGSLDYPFEAVGEGNMVDVAYRNIDGMMHAIFEADQEDAQIIAHPVRTIAPNVPHRPGVTFDLSAIGPMMESGYIAAAYYLRRLRPAISTTADFMRALVQHELTFTWEEIFAAGAETWGSTAPGRAVICGAPAPKPDHPQPSDYFIIRPPTEFIEEATRFFAGQYPAVRAALAPGAISLDEELKKRNREQREVAPEELADPPFRDMPLAVEQRRIVGWAERFSWAALSGIIGAAGSLLIALWGAAGGLRLLPAPEPLDLWLAELAVLAAAVGLGWLGRAAIVRYAWQALQNEIKKSVGF